jgi:hypothetical protein
VNAGAVAAWTVCFGVVAVATDIDASEKPTPTTAAITPTIGRFVAGVSTPPVRRMMDLNAR